MHSRLFQLTKERIINKDKAAGSYDLIDTFVGEVADYVSDDCVRSEDFRSLADALAYGEGMDKYITAYYTDDIDPDALAAVGIATKVLSEAYIIFHAGFKEAYFKPKYELFRKLADNMIFKNFMNGNGMYELEQSLEETFEYYIIGEDNPYSTLDFWLRNNIKPDADCKFWLGSTLDYHH